MDQNNPGKSTRRHVLCEMNNTTAPISSRYRAREKNLGKSQEDKITLYADVPSSTDKENLENPLSQQVDAIDKENLETKNVKQVAYSEPPYIASVRAQIKNQKADVKIKNQGRNSPSIPLARCDLLDSKVNSLIPVWKESNTSKEKDEDMDTSSNEPLHYIPPKKAGERCPPNVSKIARPPNAFMIFAKEQRQKIRDENPTESNRRVSTILGNLWNSLDEEGKAKYFLAANELEKQHKEKYPDYVYSPAEARKQKQTRLLKRQKHSHYRQEVSSESVADVESNTKLCEKPIIQEIRVETPTGKLEKSEKEQNTSLIYEEEYNFQSPFYSTNPMDSPVYWPYASEWLAPFHSPSSPRCSCKEHGSDSASHPLNSGYQKQETTQPGGHRGQVTNCGNRPISFPSMFHPAVMNPWLMFPSPFYPFSGTPAARDMYAPSWMNNHHAYSCLPSHVGKNVNLRFALPNERATEDPLMEVYNPSNDLRKEAKESSTVKETKESSKKKEEDISANENDSDHSLMIVDEHLELEDIIMDVKEKVKGKRGLGY